MLASLRGIYSFRMAYLKLSIPKTGSEDQPREEEKEPVNKGWE